MCTLTLTAGLCLIIASLGIPGLAAPPPNPCYGRRDGLYPNPDDSTTFYSCSHGTAYRQSCPVNLVFDPDVNTCVLPSTLEYPCSTPNGLFPNPDDPTTFYNCGHGIPHLLNCPVNQVFDPNVNTCVLPSTLENPCSTPNGLFPNPDDQTTFYNCGHGIPHLLNCPANLVFDPNMNRCEYSTTSLVETENQCVGKTDGKYPKADDPKSFYQCVDQKTLISTCPGILVFRECCSCCGWPALTTTTTPSTTTTTSPTTATETPTTITTAPITTTTPSTTTITPPTTTSPSTTTMPPTTTTTMPTTTTTTPGQEEGQGGRGNDCNGKSEGKFAVPGTKNMFYECPGGMIKTCPEGQTFKQRKCAPISTSKTTPPTTTSPSTTTMPTTTTTTMPTTTTTTPGQEEGQGGRGNDCNGNSKGTFPVPGTKTMFYECPGGMIKTCPEGQTFKQRKCQ